MAAHRKDRPALGDVDLIEVGTAAEERVSPRADVAEIERRRALASGFETADFAAARAGSGLVTVVRPVPSEAVAAVPEVAIGARSLEPNFTVRLPEYVQQAVRMRAVEGRTTARLVILQALRGAGFEVREEDLTDERGIVSKRRAGRSGIIGNARS